MNTIIIIFLTLIDVCYCTNGGVIETVETEILASGITEFSLDFLKRVHEDGKNTFFSGYSIALALGIMSLGAVGNTLTEINNIVHFDRVNVNDSKAIHRIFKSSTETLNNNFYYTFNIINCLYMRKTLKFKQQFKRDVNRYYDANLQQLNFSSPTTAKDIINNWITEQTNDKIKNLLSSKYIDTFAALVLVNVIYFKAYWEMQFKNDETNNAIFFTNETTKINVKMMHQTGHFNYYHDLNLKVQVLQLRYVGEVLSMFIILPDEINGLSDLIYSLTPAKFDSLFTSVKVKELEIEIPRFKLENEYSLVNVLQKLGIHDLFDKKKCNLSEMVDRNIDDINLSRALHRTFIQVTEEGTESAVVIGLQFETDSYKPLLTVNHPFLFVIRNSLYKIPLFVGVVNNPPPAEES